MSAWSHLALTKLGVAAYLSSGPMIGQTSRHGVCNRVRLVAVFCNLVGALVAMALAYQRGASTPCRPCARRCYGGRLVDVVWTPLEHESGLQS